jgi:hypothetical protein
MLAIVGLKPTIDCTSQVGKLPWATREGGWANFANIVISAHPTVASNRDTNQDYKFLLLKALRICYLVIYIGTVYRNLRLVGVNKHYRISYL